MLERRAVVAPVALAVALLTLAVPLAAQEPVFKDLTLESLQSLPPRGTVAEVPLPVRFRALEVDVKALESLLDRAPAERSSAATAAPVVLALPYPDGTDRRFRIEESPILEPALAARFPELRTFVAWGIDDPTATARLSLTPLGFHAMVLSTSGTVFVDPYRRRDAGYVLSYWKRDAQRAAGPAFSCGFRDESPGLGLGREPGADRPAEPQVIAATTGTLLRTYRLALAGTGEYTAAVCAPNPAGVACGLAAMVVSMNRVTGIYEREVSIRMVLVANNHLVVYTNGGTDPYSNGDGPTMLGQNQSNLNSVIGSAGYDIGHVFSTGGGGVANLGVPCTSSKARGVTGQPSPVGDAFDIDYVAHEMGHQFGAPHSFNGTTAKCNGNRTGSSGFEPGSGTTIMAYAGICGAEDLQPHSDDTFHTRSFDQIAAFSAGATGNSCAVRTLTGNTAPLVKVGPAATIPRQTPFTLTGSGKDTEGDALTYMWEEFDLGSAAPPNTDVSAVRPIFRSFVPSAEPSRTFPRLADILANVETLGESLPTRDRTMTFRLTARDNRGGVNWAATTVRVVTTAGPFTVTQPNTAVTWAGGSTQTVSWNVAGTTAAPVSCADVAIALSIDGGTTFEDLVATTPNDGTEPVVLPVKTTSQARLRVSCVGNVFFDISNADFTIL
jgi:Metallo-peptidase family M12